MKFFASVLSVFCCALVAVLCIQIYKEYQEKQENQETAPEEIIRTGFIAGGVAKRGGEDEQSESTTIVVCYGMVTSLLIRVDVQCDVVWIRGEADLLPEDYVTVYGQPHQLNRKQYKILQNTVLRGKPTRGQIEQFRVYLDIINAHQRLQFMQGKGHPGLAERFEALAYINAKRINPTRSPGASVF